MFENTIHFKKYTLYQAFAVKSAPLQKKIHKDLKSFITFHSCKNTKLLLLKPLNPMALTILKKQLLHQEVQNNSKSIVNKCFNNYQSLEKHN